jgi:hypothetical protein
LPPDNPADTAPGDPVRGVSDATRWRRRGGGITATAGAARRRCRSSRSGSTQSGGTSGDRSARDFAPASRL